MLPAGGYLVCYYSSSMLAWACQPIFYRFGQDFVGRSRSNDFGWL